LLPLLFVVLAIVGIQKIIRGEDVALYVYSIAEGVLLPTLPNGAWSITVEFHYYLVLPIFLWMLRKSKALPISIVIAAVALRSYLHHELGEIESLAYGTIIGRIDQFALGMLAYHFRAYFAHRHALAVSIISAFAAFYGYFDLEGGLYQYRSDIYQHPFPSPSPLWIAIPTIEGIAYAVGIAWYETSFSPSPAGISRFIGRIGEYSYSIYLLHYFVVFSVAKFVQERVMDITNFNLACLWSAVCFLLMMPLGYLSFRFVEAPFLKLRRSYIIAPRCNDNAAEAVSVKFPG